MTPKPYALYFKNLPKCVKISHILAVTLILVIIAASKLVQKHQSVTDLYLKQIIYLGCEV